MATSGTPYPDSAYLTPDSPDITQAALIPRALLRPAAGTMPPLSTGPGPVPESPPPSMGNTPADTSAITGIAPTDNPALGPVLEHHRALMKAPGNYELAPSYLEASTDPTTGQPTAAGPQTKLGKVLSILRGAGIGAAIGSTQPTFGRGVMAANQFEQQQAAENQARQQGALTLAQARQNLAFYPYLQRLGMLKTQSDIQKAQAEIGEIGAKGTKETAEAGAIPTKTALEQAQAEAANYKEDPNLGLIDIRTKQPVSSAGLVPLTDPREAAILGKQVGDRVPLKLENTASEMANRGIHQTTANGRSLLVDNAGNVIKDMGAATPLVTMQYAATGGGFGPYGGGAGGGRGNAPPAAPPANAPGGWATADGRTLNNVPAPIRGEVQQVLEYRRPDPSITQRGVVAQAINSWVSELDPQHDSTTYGNRNRILSQFTKDADTGELGAINTALGHLNDLYQASEALNQSNIPLLHSIASKWGVATGGTAESVYTGILHKVGPELSKAYLKSGGSVGERGSNEEDFALSKGQKQIQDNIFESANLLNSKLASKRNDWEKNFLPYRDQDHFDARWVTPEAHETLQTLSSRSPVAQGEAARKGGNRKPIESFHAHP